MKNLNNKSSEGILMCVTCQTDIQEKSSFLGEQKCTALYNEKDTFVLKEGKKMLDVLP